jgi:hypothetical protein
VSTAFISGATPRDHAWEFARGVGAGMGTPSTAASLPHPPHAHPRSAHPIRPPFTSGDRAYMPPPFVPGNASRDGGRAPQGDAADWNAVRRRGGRRARHRRAGDDRGQVPHRETRVARPCGKQASGGVARQSVDLRVGSTPSRHTPLAVHPIHGSHGVASSLQYHAACPTRRRFGSNGMEERRCWLRMYGARAPPMRGPLMNPIDAALDRPCKPNPATP